ncbi:MAG TPA: tetratricopeptide repeat protein [Caldithrix abyssi]|uniref:Tetratricopeptide repeat protein n=1 Tax=Caldithrix abyssi TaxID=187145 RepID=A0A7V4WTV4_CALAY|nr:tetratricopeptide repeat protein [Caldithrix abyssi]
MDKALFDDAVELFEKGLLTEAEQKFRAILDDNKKNYEALYYLGYIHFKRDEYDEAIDYLNKAVKVNETDARAYEVLGQALGFKARQSGAVKGAMLLPKVKKTFEKALALNGDSLIAREGLYILYLFAPSVAGGDETKAKQLVDEIKNLNTARGHLAEAIYYSKLNKIDEAGRAFEQAAEVGKDDPEIQQKAGMYFLESNNTEKAGKLFERFMELQPDNPAAYASKGDYLAAVGQNEEAVKMYDMALEKNKDFFPARFKRAQVFQKMGETSKAKEDYQFIVSNFAKTPFAARAKKALANL